MSKGRDQKAIPRSRVEDACQPEKGRRVFNPEAKGEVEHAPGGKYRFVPVKRNYEDYASGRVLYGAPGATAFPVRLASELFQRCAAYISSRGATPPYTLYDPCCGGGYLATIIGLLHGESLNRIVASDISPEAVELARKNLSLLDASGLDRRMAEINELIRNFRKSSHLEALESAARLKRQLDGMPNKITVECCQLDILGDTELPPEVGKVNMVITDLPYGNLAIWSGAVGDSNPAQRLLANVRKALNQNSVVGLVSDKKQEIVHDGYRRVGSLRIGKRRALLLAPVWTTE
jgi:SAM-dependent methyltransferase